MRDQTRAALRRPRPFRRRLRLRFVPRPDLPFATLHATGQPAKHEPFAPLPEGFRHVAYGDFASLERAADPTAVAGILLEVIEGEGGVVPAPEGYLTAVRRLCDERGILLMLDEIQTGLGRSGRWFAFQREGIVPDVVTLAKALGNGMPVGACWARAEITGGASYPVTMVPPSAANPLERCRRLCHARDDDRPRRARSRLGPRSAFRRRSLEAARGGVEVPRCGSAPRRGPRGRARRERDRRRVPGGGTDRQRTGSRRAPIHAPAHRERGRMRRSARDPVGGASPTRSRGSRSPSGGVPG